MKENIESYVEKIIKEKIKKITICSRLTWKNIVYYCETETRKYAIKVYKKDNSAYVRKNVEIAMYKIFSDIKINVPKIYYCGEMDEYYILISEWIEAMSLKKLINNNGVVKNQNIIKDLLENYKHIWNLNISNEEKKMLSFNKLEKYSTPSMIYTRVKVNEEDLFLEFKNIDDIDKIHRIYDKLKKEINPKQYIINSDISLHEVLIKDKGFFMIDLESFTVGDINNDLAGIFYSLSNSIINKKCEIECLMNIIRNNEYFSPDIFIFYLIERIFCANYLDTINTNEIKFYINFILNKERMF